MGCSCFKHAPSPYPTVPVEFMETLKTQTSLSRSQIQYLYNRFCQFGSEADSLPPRHLHKYNFYSGRLQLNPLLPTILNCMFGERSVISFVDFALFLSTFQAHSLKTTEEQKVEIKNHKLRLLFNMYDHTKDGRITKVDLVMIVHKLFSNLLDHRQIMNIVDSMMSEMDTSDTNQILFNDFCQAFEVFDMTEMLVMWIPEFKGRLSDPTDTPDN
ncbi:calcineurin B homologous protein 3 [Scaptodrosophila lebanonensis]|uniref:Calcineurin B homologous protein 3 n=1 Tax=Drosophila lebanonensis TaxID=7225 RepID=A0A6J2T755_DROLE|nr:calcineurin B homologous protein 3 [Scaptodrosophila lebanonensis]